MADIFGPPVVDIALAMFSDTVGHSLSADEKLAFTAAWRACKDSAIGIVMEDAKTPASLNWKISEALQSRL